MDKTNDETKLRTSNAADQPDMELDVEVEAQRELDDFVENNRSTALDYLKLLKEEVTKTDQSRTRHTYATWLLIGMFFLLDNNFAQLSFSAFKELDQTVLLKTLPAAIAACYYTMMSRFFIQRERLILYGEIARRIFGGKYFPLNNFIRPSHFMLSERLLNRYRQGEVFANNVMLGLIVLLAAYGPGIIGVYTYIITLNKFGIHDNLVRMAVIVGLVFLVQALVVMRGSIVMSRQDRQAGKMLSTASDK